jgi:hypothetical protein
MRLLTATRSGQGTRAGDFCFAVEGELVLVNDDVCATDRGDPDGGCGCGRAFVGLSSRKGTTTAAVRDLDLSPEDVRVAVEGFQIARGLTPDLIGERDFAELVTAAVEQVDVLARVLPDRGVFGRRLDSLHARPGADPDA